jgi:hypothetical protein
MTLKLAQLKGSNFQIQLKGLIFKLAPAKKAAGTRWSAIAYLD